MSLTFLPIGIIHSPYKTKEDAPIQGKFNPDIKGEIEIFSEYQEGLKDIETFSHLILLYHFNKAGEVKLTRLPFLDDKPHGIFASRHPCRPNGLGLTVVRLFKHSQNILEIRGIDVLDETPLLDIKPYVLRFDCFPEASEGWYTFKKERTKPPGRE
ncbi:MAG: tRNA (N6-threonylcarbamoyladenosine(37)-N6)-methyltransferase TrmO [bacterium]